MTPCGNGARHIKIKIKSGGPHLPIHFGMPTLIESPSLEQSLLLCSELGIDFVELSMNLPEYQLDSIDAAAANQLFHRYGKYPTIHLEENLNVCDFNAAVADAYLHTVLGAIALAKDIAAPIINIHLHDGVYFTLPDKKIYLFERYKELYLGKLRTFRDVCTDEIGGSNIIICIENCGTYRDFQQEGIALLLESPCFALTYDVGHDFIVGNGNLAFIMRYANRLKHLHLHDAEGNNNHLTLGTGEIDIAEKISMAVKHDCRCVVETKTADALRKSAAYIKNILLNENLCKD
jgi:sugar phosphate isomerase/epimerase